MSEDLFSGHSIYMDANLITTPADVVSKAIQNISDNILYY